MYILCEIYIYIIFVLHLLNPIPVGGGKITSGFSLITQNWREPKARARFSCPLSELCPISEPLVRFG